MELTHTVVEGWDGGKKEIVKFFRISGKLSQKLARCLALQGVTNRRAARAGAHTGARAPAWSLGGGFGGLDGVGTVFTQKLDFNQN